MGRPRILPDVPPASELLSVSGAASYLGVAAKTIYNWRSAGRLTAFRVGGCARVWTRELDAQVKMGLTERGITVIEGGAR